MVYLSRFISIIMSDLHNNNICLSVAITVPLIGSMWLIIRITLQPASLLLAAVLSLNGRPISKIGIPISHKIGKLGPGWKIPKLPSSCIASCGLTSIWIVRSNTSKPRKEGKGHHENKTSDKCQTRCWRYDLRLIIQHSMINELIY